MEEKQQEIIIGTYEIFKSFGIRSVSMDDIAQQLRVSKKTLYVYYSNKKDLLEDVLNYSVVKEDLTDKINVGTGNAIDSLLQMVRLATESMKNINPVLLFDLNKYYPELSEIHFEQKTKLIYGQVISNMERGVKEGLYRDNLNAELITSLYTERIKDIKEICGRDTMQKFSFGDIVSQIVEGHIRGIANEQGIAYLEEQKRQNALNTETND